MDATFAIAGPPSHLYKLLQFFNHSCPTAGVVLARGRQIRQAAVRDLHVRAISLLRQFPANHRADRGIFVPTADPGVDEKARRIAFENLAVTLELADTVPENRSCVGGISILATDAG